VLRSKLLLAHCSNILQILIPAHNAVLLDPTLFGGLSFPSQAFAGGFDGGWPSPALLAAAANQGHPIHPAAPMPESPPSAGPLLAPLSAAAAACSAPGCVFGGGDGWARGLEGGDVRRAGFGGGCRPGS
jgi:hypothetical protein